LELELLSRGGCQDGDCAAVYKTGRRSFIIRGNSLSPAELATVKLGAGENAVEIPEELLQDVANILRNS